MGKSQEPQEDFERRRTPSDVPMSPCCPLPPYCLLTTATAAHSSPDMPPKQAQERRGEGVQPATPGISLCRAPLEREPGQVVVTRGHGYFLVQERTLSGDSVFKGYNLLKKGK